MTESSFEKFNYALRPAKNIERKMFCEALCRLPRVAPLSTYRYIGFGALAFHDFTLFHQRLGINDMISIEGNRSAEERITRNIPYSCIKMGWGMSYDVLPTLDWGKRTILWLDYEAPLHVKPLEDIALATAKLVSGSVLIVTVPADPGEVEKDTDMAEKRLSQLRDRVGRNNMPPGIAGKDLAKWGMARALRTIIVNKILRTLADRNAPLEDAEKCQYLQLFNFHYADGIKMLSIGGLILNNEDQGKLAGQHFADLDYYRPSDEPYLIESPLLTWREVKLLDELLPQSAPEVPNPDWIPEAERKKYGKVYRYYPSYSEVEM